MFRDAFPPKKFKVYIDKLFHWETNNLMHVVHASLLFPPTC